MHVSERIILSSNAMVEDDLKRETEYLCPTKDGSADDLNKNGDHLNTDIKKPCQRVGDLADEPPNTDVENLRQRIDDLAISPTKQESCCHPGFIKHICYGCGKHREYICDAYRSAIPFRYIHKHMKLSENEIIRLKNMNTDKLLERKKLYLVLDLDNTLLHTTSLKNVTSAEKINGQHDIFYTDSGNTVVRLRPHIHEFLEKAHRYFDMYVYTLGLRNYAKAMVQILDPNGVYFGPRIVAREDCTHEGKKSLDVILGRESEVVIVDDREDVWRDYKENLIRVNGFSYFSTNRKWESDNGLEKVLEVLMKIHTMFFQGYNEKLIVRRDIREIMKEIRASSAEKNKAENDLKIETGKRNGNLNIEIESLHQRIVDLAKSPTGQRVCIKKIHGPRRYIDKQIKLRELIEIAQLKNIYTNELLIRRKLCLVLELHHTLLDLTYTKDAKTNENFQEKDFFQVVKLRPYVLEFLEKASKMFVMFVCTLSCPEFANAMVRILDPEGLFFGSRVITRKDCTKAKNKGLDLIPGRECAVVIVDAKAYKWSDQDKKNLVHIHEYSYFSRGNKSCRRVEKSDGALEAKLEELKTIHMKFFDGYDEAKFLERDVRDVIKEVRLSSMQRKG